MDCREAREDLMALIQGELDADRARALRDHLSLCPPCLDEERSVLDTLNLTRLVRRDEIDLPPDLFGRITDALDHERVPSSPLPMFPAAPVQARVPWVAAAAVLLACVAALTLFLDDREKTHTLAVVGRLACAEGRTFAVSPGGALEPLSPGAAVLASTEVRADGIARIDLEGGVRLGLERGAVRLRKAEAVLLGGNLGVSVRESRPFTVVTPHGSVRVRGTMFHLAVRGDRTRVLVERGAVTLSNPAGTMDLGPGDAAAMDRIAPPRRAGRGVTPAWTRLLSSDTLHLDLIQPVDDRPRVLEFKITNVSPRPLLLPRFDPDRPLFTLRLRLAPTGKEGVVNLAPFLIRRDDSRAE
ncbi:MAG: FecR domain-containing protein, partial [Planctomycetota bacterium]